MPPQGTQTYTDQHAEHIIIAFGESSKRMHKAAAAADDRVDQGKSRAAELVRGCFKPEAAAFGLYPCPLEPYLSFQMLFYLKHPPVTAIGV